MLRDLEDAVRDGWPENRPVVAAMLIDGAFTRGSAHDVIRVENPANERVVATIPDGTAADAHAALAAARRAQVLWAAVPAPERGRLVGLLADRVRDHAELLARIVVAEQGKPLREARGEIGAAETFLRYAAEGARRIEGDIVPSDHRAGRPRRFGLALRALGRGRAAAHGVCGGSQDENQPKPDRQVRRVGNVRSFATIIGTERKSFYEHCHDESPFPELCGDTRERHPAVRHDDEGLRSGNSATSIGRVNAGAASATDRPGRIAAR